MHQAQQQVGVRGGNWNVPAPPTGGGAPPPSSPYVVMGPRVAGLYDCSRDTRSPLPEALLLNLGICFQFKKEEITQHRIYRQASAS